jgi:hypothetical protein
LTKIATFVVVVVVGTDLASAGNKNGQCFWRMRENREKEE